MQTSLFFFNDTATTEIYTLSLHDALPIYSFPTRRSSDLLQSRSDLVCRLLLVTGVDRKSTRLNSSHDQISYAVFCLKKKKKRVLYRYHFPYSRPFLSNHRTTSDIRDSYNI